MTTETVKIMLYLLNKGDALKKTMNEELGTTVTTCNQRKYMLIKAYGEKKISFLRDEGIYYIVFF